MNINEYKFKKRENKMMRHLYKLIELFVLY